MADLEIMRAALSLAHTKIKMELEAMMRMLREIPAQVAPRIVDAMPEYVELLSVLDHAISEVEDAKEEVADLEKRCDLYLRRQKQWRVLACRAIMGEAHGAELKHQAFKDFISDPPDHNTLDDQLHALVERLEAMESAAEEFGELRSIMIDKGGIQ